MTPMEQHVWAAAFAAAIASACDFVEQHGLEYAAVYGFTAAERADLAVERLRDALAHDDAEYLTPVEEGWTWTQPTGAETRPTGQR